MVDRTIEFEKAKKEAHETIEKLGGQIPPKAVPMIEEAVAKMKVDNLLTKDALLKILLCRRQLHNKILKGYKNS